MEQYHSTPDMRTNSMNSTDRERRLYSMSLSQIRKTGEFTEYHHKPSPFNLRWIYGFNAKAGVINLNRNGSTTLFYAANNCGVLYNWTTNQMRILQGHRHMVTMIAADGAAKWLITADSGPENILTIWDIGDFFPQRTLFSPHGRAPLQKVAFSADAKFLLTLAYTDKAQIYWWIWSFGIDEPHAKLELDIPKEGVLKMKFNPSNSTQFALMTKQDIWIGVNAKIFVVERGLLIETENYELKIHKPDKNISLDIGTFTCFTFVKETQVLVGTSKGGIIIFAYTMEFRERNQGPSNYEQLKYIKVLKIEHHRINVIKSVDGVIVTGNSAGEIHFYDEQVKLLYWVHGFQVDCIKDISFNINPRSYLILDPLCNKKCLCWEKVVMVVDPKTGLTNQTLMKTALPSDATVNNKPFIVRDFVIRTSNEGVSFVDLVTESLTTINDYTSSNAASLAVHPEKSFLSVGYTNGIVELINFVQRKIFRKLDLRQHFKVIIPPKEDSIKGDYEVTVPKLSATCLKYSPSGLHLACGLNTGELLFLDPTTINIIKQKSHQDTTHAIKEINYSNDSLTLALCDTNKTVCVYKYDCDTFAWTFIGKHRAHYKDITSVIFTPAKNETGDYKLLSLGRDRMMVEYDIGASSGEYLEILSLDRIDQTAVPLNAVVWPTPRDVMEQAAETPFRTDLPLILMATNEHKYKIVNYSTTMTLATVLGPRYETPVNKMFLVRQDDKDYIVFATKNVIGLQKLPLDGNPWKHVGLLGHSNQILEVCFQESTGILFTIGAKDSSVCQWVANYRSVETTEQQGGIELDPYYCLVEDGRPGWLFQEIRDLFYYIQILCQGTFSPAMRKVKDYIAVDSLPDLMRALGFFPSEYEVENLLVEAKYKVYQSEETPEIDFVEFVKLYLNHRPAFGENYPKILNAFQVFANYEQETCQIHRDDFIFMLTNYGECFSSELAWYLLSILKGLSFEDRSKMQEGDFSFLPEIITFSELLTSIIGVQDVDGVSEQHSGLYSCGSQHTGSTVTSQSD